MPVVPVVASPRPGLARTGPTSDCSESFSQSATRPWHPKVSFCGRVRGRRGRRGQLSAGLPSRHVRGKTRSSRVESRQLGFASEQAWSWSHVWCEVEEMRLARASSQARDMGLGGLLKPLGGSAGHWRGIGRHSDGPITAPHSATCTICLRLSIRRHGGVEPRPTTLMPPGCNWCNAPEINGQQILSIPPEFPDPSPWPSGRVQDGQSGRVIQCRPPSALRASTVPLSPCRQFSAPLHQQLIGSLAVWLLLGVCPMKFAGIVSVNKSNLFGSVCSFPAPPHGLPLAVVFP